MAQGCSAANTLHRIIVDARVPSASGPRNWHEVPVAWGPACQWTSCTAFLCAQVATRRSWGHVANLPFAALRVSQRVGTVRSATNMGPFDTTLKTEVCVCGLLPCTPALRLLDIRAAHRDHGPIREDATRNICSETEHCTDLSDVFRAEREHRLAATVWSRAGRMVQECIGPELV